MFIMEHQNVSSVDAIGVLALLGLDSLKPPPPPGYNADIGQRNKTPQWRLPPPCCCDDWQFESLIVIGTTALVTLFLWNSLLLAPFKLIAVFLHEFSHAVATWLTCGRVVAIQINENYGGMIRTDGGVRWLILSAGYTGSVVWGSFFMLMSWTKDATRVAAGLFVLSCVGTCLALRIEDKEKKKRTCGVKFRLDTCLRVCIALLGTLPAVFWFMESYGVGSHKIGKSVYPLRWFILNTGTTCTLHAVYDCLHDVLFKNISDTTQGTSDAVLFAEEFFGTPRCWGLIWASISLAVVATVLFGVLLLEGNYG